MTWSQMDYFARACRLAEIDQYRTGLAIAHNPYGKTRHDREKLSNSLNREEQSLVSGRAVQRGGIKIGDLYRAFGPAKREQVSRAEWDRQRAERLAARERTRELMEQRANGGKQE